MLCFSIALWLWPRMRENDRAWEAALFSTALAFAVVCRPQNALGAGLLALAGLMAVPRRWPVMAAPAVLLAAALVSYNLTVFDSILGGYSALYRAEAHIWRGLDPSNVFSLPLGVGIPSVLLSPGKGLFIYTPLTVIAFVMLPVLAFRRPTPLVWAILLWLLASTILFAKNRLWWGGTSYGPRYFTELMPGLIVALGMGWRWIERSRLLVSATVALGWFGVFVQVVGALTWPCGWHSSPTWVDFDLDRLYDWKDPEIDRCIRKLASTGPTPPEWGPLAPPR
jgi:hypothetical protein